MNTSTSPSLPSLRALLGQPSWQRRVFIHRVIAVALVAVALALAVTPDRDTVAVYVAARDIPAGTPLGVDDFRMRHLPSDAVPTPATEFDPATADAAVAPISAGEVMTPGRVLHPLSAAALAGEGATLVPVTVHSPDVAALVRHGDTVTVIAAARDGGPPEILAERARVALPSVESTARSERSGSAATVVVAVAPAEAVRIAAAATSNPLTIVIKQTG